MSKLIKYWESQLNMTTSTLEDFQTIYNMTEPSHTVKEFCISKIDKLTTKRDMIEEVLKILRGGNDNENI